MSATHHLLRICLNNWGKQKRTLKAPSVYMKPHHEPTRPELSASAAGSSATTRNLVCRSSSVERGIGSSPVLPFSYLSNS
ncbi:hypothetical protein V6N13_073921 [Hibiscus sabdariffa]|uniref:Uncharacterized protein n=1 Tax=Hibiscus sabdariffa TaxID=183260 RepID=A0ABR2U789_9ROSI